MVYNGHFFSSDLFWMIWGYDMVATISGKPHVGPSFGSVFTLKEMGMGQTWVPWDVDVECKMMPKICGLFFWVLDFDP